MRSAGAEPEPETAPSFLGKECQLLSPSGSWRECTVVEERPGEVKVHYDGFDSQHDEWIGTDSPRLRWAQRGARSPQLQGTVPGFTAPGFTTAYTTQKRRDAGLTESLIDFDDNPVHQSLWSADEDPHVCCKEVTICGSDENDCCEYAMRGPIWVYVLCVLSTCVSILMMPWFPLGLPGVGLIWAYLRCNYKCRQGERAEEHARLERNRAAQATRRRAEAQHVRDWLLNDENSHAEELYARKVKRTQKLMRWLERDHAIECAMYVDAVETHYMIDAHEATTMEEDISTTWTNNESQIRQFREKTRTIIMQCVC